YQRNIMEVDDIELAVVQNLPDFPAIHHRSAHLLRQQYRSCSEAATQPDHLNAILWAVGHHGLGSPIQTFKTIDVLQDSHVMPTPRQCLRQKLNSYCISTKAVRRIKCRDHAKADAAHH